VRFLVSVKKITQDITKDTWSLVPYFTAKNNILSKENPIR